MWEIGHHMWALLRVKGSINSGGICGSSSWLPETVGGAIYTCSVRPDVSMHQDALLWGPPMTPGSLAAGSVRLQGDS